jgi:hypothetical protein
VGFSVKIDVTALERVAGRLDNISGAALGDATRRAVNVTADSVYELARPRMIADINLTDEYVKSRMVVNHAKPGGKAEAVITGRGSKSSMTQLVNYGAMQQIQRVNHTNASILASGKKFGKWPGWTKRTGDAMRGIAADNKQSGVSVAVKRGSNKLLEHGFLIQLSNGAGIGLATRSAGAKGRKNYKVRYGPSVYQLFRHVASGLLDEARDELETNTVAQVVELFEKELR